MRAAIRLGLQIPHFNFAGVEPEDLCERLCEIATTAEASGFDSLFVMDHFHQIGADQEALFRLYERDVLPRVAVS